MRQGVGIKATIAPATSSGRTRTDLTLHENLESVSGGESAENQKSPRHVQSLW